MKSRIRNLSPGTDIKHSTYSQKWTNASRLFKIHHGKGRERKHKLLHYRDNEARHTILQLLEAVRCIRVYRVIKHFQSLMQGDGGGRIFLFDVVIPLRVPFLKTISDRLYVCRAR